MHGLQSLTWTLPTCALPSQDSAYLFKDFDLPASLRCLDLTILWDHEEEHYPLDLDLLCLSEWGWHEKLTNLRILSSDFNRERILNTCAAQVNFGLPTLVFLESLHCESFDLGGMLNAPQLKHLHLSVDSEDDFEWSVFKHCCQLGAHCSAHKRNVELLWVQLSRQPREARSVRGQTAGRWLLQQSPTPSELFGFVIFCS